MVIGRKSTITASAGALALAIVLGGPASAATMGESQARSPLVDIVTLNAGDTAHFGGPAMPSPMRMRGHGFGNKFGYGLPRGVPAYRRPFRGFVLPTFWSAPRFYVVNYATYGLAQPATGYNWARYYDDAVLIDGRGTVYDSVHDLDWGRYEHGGERYDYDEGIYGGDHVVYGHGAPAGPPVTQGGAYDGAWTGSYVGEDGRVYQGSWSGAYVDETGQAYEGEYSGTFIGEGRYVDANGVPVQYDYGEPAHDQAGVAYGHGYDPRDAAPAHPPVAERHAVRRDDRRYHDRSALMERCRRDNGLGGALIGGVVGGLAGNRIAGRGNRTEGTIIGAGVGAIAGAAIDVAEDDCKEFRRDDRYDGRHHAERRYPARPSYPAHGYPVQQPYPAYGYPGYGYPAYYWYQPAPTVTTVIVQPSVTTTTTTTTTYEEVYVGGGTKVRTRKTKLRPSCNC
ncbi:MAG: RcnB family protein [Blastomonas sp.]